MNTKRIIIAVSVVLVLALAAYLIYIKLTPPPTPAVSPSPAPTETTGTPEGTLDLSTFQIPDEPNATVKPYHPAGTDLIILVNKDKMTLYFFAKDESNKSNCFDTCAKNWPPLTIGELDGITTGSGIGKKALGTIERDGVRQVTYNGKPLYTYIGDKKPGDMTGKNIPNWTVAGL